MFFNVVDDIHPHEPPCAVPPMIPKILTVPSPTASSAPCTFSSHSHRISRCDSGQQQKVKVNEDFSDKALTEGEKAAAEPARARTATVLAIIFLLECWISLRFKKQTVFFIQHVQEKSLK